MVYVKKNEYICGMKATEKARDYIKRWEGLRLQAYLCPSGVWTIGYGHTEGVKRGQTIRPSEAEALFDADLGRYESAVADMAEQEGVELTQGRFDALVSFAYNVGVEALRGSTLWKKACANVEDSTISDEFGRWVWGTRDGKKIVLQGLVNRRKGEAKFWKGEI